MYLQEVYNGEISFSVDVDTIPNSSDIVGISNDILEILKPVKFALLSGLGNNVTSKLGFKNSKEGTINPTISTTKINPHFRTSHSNTIKSDEITIKSSKFVKMYDNKFSNYLMIESYDSVPYDKGDCVYFENHVLNKFIERNYKADELLIKRIYPLKDWFYSIESRYIHHILSYGKLSLDANPFTLISGSTEIIVTHNEHGLNVGDKITIEGAATVLASSVTAANLNVTTSIKRIVDKNSYIIEPTIDATPNTNASLGTDHGVAGPMYVFGNQVKGGFHGEHPSLSLLDQGDLIMTTDFRSVYASMIQEWMGVQDVGTVLRGDFAQLSLIA